MKYIYVSAIIFLLFVVVGCTNSGENYDNTRRDREYLEIKGSDTMVQLVSNLAEAYSEIDSSVRISATGGGSGTGIAGLINGENQIVSSSRPIEEEELNLASQKGLQVIEIIIGKDTISVIVNQDNDITKLTMDELGKIFKGEITNWKEVGGEEAIISLYGRQSTSGTYRFFREEVVKDEYSPNKRSMEGNQAIVEAIRQDKTGIGYVGIGYILNENKELVQGINVISVANNEESEYNSPISGNIENYPISRNLYQYVANKPSKNSALYKFIEFELSNEGQNIVQETGFFPISINEIEMNQKNLGIE
ncbi:MAG: PstS family phosphate ABC transporter substrate-binding protein [Candidatus Woesearchaeota archaeon]